MANGGMTGYLSATEQLTGVLSQPTERLVYANMDYEQAENQPKINGETVVGDKVGADYHLQDKMDVLTVQEIERILYLD